MPTVRKPRPVAIACADIHFSERPPVCRSEEPDWFAAMKRAWNGVEDVARQYKVPIIIAGDIFHRWRSSPELVNFVISLFRPWHTREGIFAVPGQHDLPHHCYGDLPKSAYWTLVQSDCLHDLGDSFQYTFVNDELNLYGFPWGTPVKEIKRTRGSLRVAVVHKYLYEGQPHFPGAEGSLRKYRRILSSYDAVAVGDNHQHWQWGSIFNCGSLMRRRADERDLSPRVGLLRNDGTWESIALSTEEDRWTGANTPSIPNFPPGATDASGFCQALRELEPDSLSFRAAVSHYLETHAVEPLVRKEVLTMLGE